MVIISVNIVISSYGVMTVECILGSGAKSPDQGKTEKQFDSQLGFGA